MELSQLINIFLIIFFIFSNLGLFLYLGKSFFNLTNEIKVSLADGKLTEEEIDRISKASYNFANRAKDVYSKIFLKK
jgi:hypothetical protein